MAGADTQVFDMRSNRGETTNTFLSVSEMDSDGVWEEEEDESKDN